MSSVYCHIHSTAVQVHCIPQPWDTRFDVLTCMSGAVDAGAFVHSGMQVNAEAIKIGKEAEEANAIASECQAGLDKALPALQAAEDALNVLTKKDMSELKVCLTYCHQSQ